jgi:hypothetical protein
VPLGRRRERRAEAVQHRVQRHTARQVRLRVDEDLRVPDALRRRPRQVRVGQLGEVPFGAQHGHERVVEVQERRQIGERVRGAQLVRRRERQVDAVARREGERRLGLQRPLDVQVQFGLRNGHGDGHGHGGLRSGATPM